MEASAGRSKIHWLFCKNPVKMTSLDTPRFYNSCSQHINDYLTVWIGSWILFLTSSPKMNRTVTTARVSIGNRDFEMQSLFSNQDNSFPSPICLRGSCNPVAKIAKLVSWCRMLVHMPIFLFGTLPELSVLKYNSALVFWHIFSYFNPLFV